MLPSNINPIEAKDAFAAASLRFPNEPLKAALAVFPHNMTAALFIMQEWPHDAYIVARKKVLLETDGPEAYLPSKYELAHDVYHVASTTTDAETRIKAYKLFADIQGHISKPSTAVQINTHVKQKVLVVHKYDDKTVEEAQAKLLREMAEDVE